jgi:hypothetical protein
MAIGKSKLGQVFFMLAGAKFTVIRVIGRRVLLDFIALFKRSLLS